MAADVTAFVAVDDAQVTGVVLDAAAAVMCVPYLFSIPHTPPMRGGFVSVR